MPAPTATGISASAALAEQNFWNGVSAKRGWANGGQGATGTDFDLVRYVNFPRPQLFGFPQYAGLMETQDVYGPHRVRGTEQDQEIRHRQIIWGDSLDVDDTRVVIAGMVKRFTMPNYGRVRVTANLSHRLWPGSSAYAGAGANPTGFFSLWYQQVGNTTNVKEFSGSRRFTGRVNHSTSLIEPSVICQTMHGELDTSNTSPFALNSIDIVIFVAFTASTSTFFASRTSGASKNVCRLDVLNTSLVVRVFKNYVS